MLTAEANIYIIFGCCIVGLFWAILNALIINRVKVEAGEEKSFDHHHHHHSNVDPI